METAFNLFGAFSHNATGLALNGMWLGLALGALVWIGMRFTHGVAASARYITWWTTLVVVLALPLLMTLSIPGSPFSTGSELSDARQPVQRTSTYQPSAPEIEAAEVARTEPHLPTRTMAASGPTEPVTDDLGANVAVRLLPLSLTILWLFGVLLAGHRLYRSYRGMLRLKKESNPLCRHEYDYLYRLTDASHGRRVRIAVSGAINTPIAAGFVNPMIILPRPVIESLGSFDLETIVRHELTHLNRRDDWTKLIQKLIEVVFFFHPAVHLIGRQLELERELAVDEAVVAECTSVDHYARCLTRLAQLSTGGMTSLIPGALTGRKQIFLRFERLLLHLPGQTSRLRSNLIVTTLTVAVALVGVAGAQVAPALTLPFESITLADLASPEADRDSDEDKPAPARTVGTAYVDDDGTVYGTTVRQKNETVTTSYISDTLTVQAELNGRILLTEDNRGIRNLTPSGYLIFRVNNDEYDRKVAVDPDRRGELSYTYYESDGESEFDQGARVWFAERLAAFADQTGFGASERLRLIVDRKGVDDALDLIKTAIATDARRHYYEQLYLLPTLTDLDRRKISRQAGEDLDDFSSLKDLYNEQARYERQASATFTNARDAYLDRYSESGSWSVWDRDFSETSDQMQAALLSKINFTDEYTLVGDYEAEIRPRLSRLQLQFYLRRNNHSGVSRPLSSFTGLNEAWLSGTYDDVEFLLIRDAGVVEFHGDFWDGESEGEFRFRANQDYLDELVDLGLRVRRLDERDLFHMALFGVSLDFIRKMQAYGYERLKAEDCISMRIHGVELSTVQEYRDLGYDLDVDDLVTFHIHDVTPDYIRDLDKADFKDLRPDRLVQFKIHDIDPADIEVYAEVGLLRLSTEELVQLHIHDVTPEFVTEMADLGYDRLRVEDLVQFKIHDVSARMIKEFGELGYDPRDGEILVQFQIHDVTPRMVREFHELGYDDLDEETLVQFRIHDITARFVSGLAEVGYDRIRPDDLVRLKIHDVTPSYVKRLVRRGYDDLSVDDLVEFRIHDM